jgi:hypothetical protein
MTDRTAPVRRYFSTSGFNSTTSEAVPDDARATAEFLGASAASATVMALALHADAGGRA